MTAATPIPTVLAPAGPASAPGVRRRPCRAGRPHAGAGTDGGPAPGVRGFTCRLTAIANVDSPQNLASGAAAGLMVRGALSTDAPTLALVVQSNRGIHLHTRALPGLNLADQRPRNYHGGLLAPSGLLHNGHHRHANYLLRPVWLRLVQDANVWTAFTSLDGRQWTQAGIPSALEAAAVWVGLYVTPHDGSFGDKPYKMSATFDNLSGFMPTTFVLLGSP